MLKQKFLHLLIIIYENDRNYLDSARIGRLALTTYSLDINLATLVNRMLIIPVENENENDL